MEPAGIVAIAICVVALASLAPAVARGWREGKRYGELAALSLALAGLALLGAGGAELAGAALYATGRFLIGMSSGLAVGLILGCAILTLISRSSSSAAFSSADELEQ